VEAAKVESHNVQTLSKIIKYNLKKMGPIIRAMAAGQLRKIIWEIWR
jgi:hypothetical protein